MKFQLPSIQLIGKMALTLLICILIGTGLLTLVYTIPTDNISKNVFDSVYIFSYEGNYPSLSENYLSILDNFTDATMLKEASYIGPESAFQKAMLVPSNLVSSHSSDYPADEIVYYYSHPEEEHSTGTYARYWHGYLVFLKPLLTFLNYGQIRNINLYIQILINLFVIVLLLVKKKWQLIPAYALTVLMLRIGLTAYSMQHAAIFYIFSISSILLLLFSNILMKNYRYVLFFLTIGIATSYFDFLTYPLVAFGIPASLFAFINRDNSICDVRIIINLLISWFIGYLGMWAGKWIIATIFTDQNIILDAIANINIRSGSTLINGSQITYQMVISQTIIPFIATPFSLLCIAVLIVEIILFILFHKKYAKRLSISMVFIALLPFIWYSFTKNHSFSHRNLFTYKEWAVSLFAILTLFANVELKKKR